MPDYVQQVDDSKRCSPTLSCILGERKIGEDSCSKCSSGTYYNNHISRLISNASTWDTEKCVPCPNGTYASEDIAAIDECFPCSPGMYQPKSGSSGCLVCPEGSFQPNFGEVKCELCSKGGYCNAAKQIEGGFTACPPGTYNDKPGQSNNIACIQCPPGTYSNTNGAESVSTCLQCLPGTYNNKSGELL